ncbi:hypothetical protein ANANG_G00302500 [Anguilla anguilla]|uniref:tRNA (32-2'-O)-methyltransferase regulator THADA n=1 Tax=Anguilla anguilla TaxID=7936 RepID=A0A9D3LI98_ANGAN|nr:hypothetical protein ANANG_G00302500 [Anguilla anguilla]
MVVKKKTAKVETVALDRATLEKLTASLSVDGDPGAQKLAQNLLDCLRLTDPVLQIQQVKKVANLLEELSEGPSPADGLLLSCLDTLAVMYTSLQSKNPLKRAVASTLSSVPAWLHGQAARRLSACLSDCLSSAGPERYPHLTDTLASCLDGFPLGERCIHTLLTEVLQFFHRALCEYLQQNSGLAGRHVAQAQVMQACLSAVKASMLVVQRSQEPVSAALLAECPPSPCPLRDTLNALLACYTRILTDEEFVQTVQSTAGMAVVLLTRCMLGSGDKVAEVVAGLLLGPEQGADSAPVWLQESCAGLYRGDRPPAVSLFLCHGALAMLSWRGGPLGPEGERLLLLIPSALLALDTSVKESSTAMVVSRVLALWSTVALDGLQGAPSSSGLREALLGRAELPGRLQEHIQAHWEHPLDGVRHQTRALFRNLLRLHQACAGVPDPASDPFVTELTHSLLGLEWHVRGKYASLACLVEHLGTGRLLALHPALPSRLLSLMDDQSLAPHAGDLLERLFVSHKAQLRGRVQWQRLGGWMEEWNRTWVTPLLDVLCQARLDQTTYILDYLLPKLLRCCPASLAHMVQVLQNAQFGTSGSPGSRGGLGALMTCLRAARAHGVDHLAEEGFLGGLVSHSLLQQALLHKHDQVRMDALGLVCESHRSTETVSREEIDLIRHFLPSNLNSQSPGVRQQTVSLLKKLLGRVKDSAQLLQKRLGQERGERAVQEGDRSTLEMYQDFLRWFCETLFEVLAPGASFPTCLTALHLLGLVADLFTFSTGPASFALGDTVSHAHAQAVLYCLASNFLEVKQLASTLLRKLPPQTVGLQEPSRMRSLLRVALDLSTSTKPFDSVTAAHLLGLLAHQEELMDALAHCAQEQGIPFQPPSPGELHASSASTLEKNTLGVVQVLLLCLRAEVERAEASLLQAAASYPLYGRAHCITAALKQLPAGSLSLKAQWRTVVADLITTFYRMSDVVSPVVQSSSPEGLIPMDTDSETSAGLQKILQEIQPRDTNDFFTDARETQAGGQPGHIPQSENTGGSGEGYRVTAQMVLVCCWRSMKEVSMLLGQVCQDMPLQTREACRDGIITEGQVEGVGRYFRQQLLQSRHRGAFELAYVGFVRLTDMLCRSGSQSLQQLPSHWLKEVLEEALLSSEPKSSSCSLLKMTMKELTSLAMPDPQHLTNRSTVPQVHALNILRALYRDTRLGENIVPFSPIWAVRNSSTLLFSTLITRIFGVKKGKDEHSKKNRMTGREFFTRFPALYPFLLGQLEEAAGSVDSDSGEVKLHPSLFLLLLILGRLYPSPMDGSSSPLGLAPFMPFIIRCGRSAVYRTREMAARALVPFVLVTQVPSTIRALLEDLPLELGPGTQQNHIHGTLLQVLHLLRSYESDTHRPRPGGIGQDSDITAALRARLWLARRNPCLVTRAAFLDLLMSLCGSALASAVDPELTALCEETLEVLTDSELLAPDGPVAVTGPGATQYLQSLARVAASASTEDPELWGAGSRGPRILGCLLQCPQYEVRHLALEAVLRRLERAADTPGDPGPAHYSFTSMALHERDPQCLTKVLQVLSGLPWSSVLPWRDGTRALTNEEALTWLMTLAEDSVHSVELHCAALALLSRLMVRLMDTAPQGRGVAAVSVLSRWGALVSRCCSEEQPEEVKLTAAEVLVKAMPSLLASPAYPWDEDLDVRDRASDFTATVQTQLLHNKYADVAPAALCPPVALDLGVGLLCQLLQVWEQVPAGVLVLTEWLLGEGEPEAGGEDTTRLDEYEEEFLFEKGELNLWAEPLRWARLLHRHLLALLRVPGVASGVAGASRAELDRLRTLAGDHAHTARQRLHALPPLPQFSCTIDHARLDVQRERAELALEVLKSLIPAAQSQ